MKPLEEERMKFLAMGLFVSLLAPYAMATTDGYDSVLLVVPSVQEDGEFRLMSAPIVACYGTPMEPRLKQFVSTYKAPYIGCAGEDAVEPVNINALTCASVESYIENDSYDGLKSIALDISKCAHKGSDHFKTMIRTAVSRNFKGSGRRVSLELKE
jgi:hypothetical protein